MAQHIPKDQVSVSEERPCCPGVEHGGYELTADRLLDRCPSCGKESTEVTFHVRRKRR